MLCLYCFNVLFQCSNTLQVVGAVLSALSHTVVGAVIGLPSVVLPSLTDPDSSDIYLEPTQVAIFGM